MKIVKQICAPTNTVEQIETLIQPFLDNKAQWAEIISLIGLKMIQLRNITPETFHNITQAIVNLTQNKPNLNNPHFHNALEAQHTLAQTLDLIQSTFAQQLHTLYQAETFTEKLVAHPNINEEHFNKILETTPDQIFNIVHQTNLPLPAIRASLNFLANPANHKVSQLQNFIITRVNIPTSELVTYFTNHPEMYTTEAETIMSSKKNYKTFLIEMLKPTYPDISEQLPTEWLKELHQNHTTIYPTQPMQLRRSKPIPIPSKNIFPKESSVRIKFKSSTV